MFGRVNVNEKRNIFYFFPLRQSRQIFELSFFVYKDFFLPTYTQLSTRITKYTCVCVSRREGGDIGLEITTGSPKNLFSAYGKRYDTVLPLVN